MPSPDAYRAEADLSLFTELVAHERVRPILKRLDELKVTQGTRRSLLANALRLTPAIAPELHEVVGHCVDVLEVTAEPELYVYPSAQFNAACTPQEGGRVFVLLSSSLAEAFTADELQFVLGHELGHHVYNHHALPVQLVARPDHRLPAPLVLRMLSWQRYAEISCDRAGLMCSGGLGPAARALFKLSSGLTRPPAEDHVAAYLAQADELFAEADRVEGPGVHNDWLSTHPFSPLRLTAARAFTRSAFMVDAGVTISEVEGEVQEVMALMEPSYLEEDSAEAEQMRRVLLAGGVVLASVDGTISDEELTHLTELLGQRRMPARLDPGALEADLPARMARAVEVVRPARRAQVLRDLASLARADGRVHERERARLLAWADELDVNVCVVIRALDAELELD